MKKLRSLLAAVVLAAMAVLPFAGSASASSQRPATTPTLQTDAPNNCQSTLIDNGWVGEQVSSGTESAESYGAEASILANIHPCIDTSGTDAAGGPSVWVAVQGSGGCDLGINAGCQIVQMGIQSCDDANAPTDSPCYGSRAHTPRYFYAWGRKANDCTQYGAHVPRPIDLGPAALLTYYNFRIRLLDGHWLFYIGGNVVKDLTDTYCWTTSTSVKNSNAWYGERWDGADSIGLSSTQASVFDSPLSLTNNIPPVTGNSGGWASVNPSLGPCTTSGDQAFEQHCSRGTSYFTIWDVLE